MKVNNTLSLNAWLRQIFSHENIVLTRLQGDAGFRVYYRFEFEGVSYIAVDAPPAYSNNQAFIDIALHLRQHNIAAPEVIASDVTFGYLCISDLGTCDFGQYLTSENQSAMYQQAVETLIDINTLPLQSSVNLEEYDHAFVERELAIFTEWLLGHYLDISLTPVEQTQLRKCFNELIENALAQPQVFMHRDYHSRNIMIQTDGELAIIDFQDAVKGPITYDIVSLLRDCYKELPQSLVDEKFAFFCRELNKKILSTNVTTEQWQRWFDLMGMQRHLKAVGIFARLSLRDDKHHYLPSIPLTLQYIADVCANYQSLSFLHQLITHQVLPSFARKMQSNQEKLN